MSVDGLRFEFRKRYFISYIVEPELNRHPDTKLVRCYARYPGRETWSFVQLDDYRRIRDVIGECGVERLINRRPAIDFAAALGRSPFPPQRVTSAAHRPWRMPPRAATLASLKAQLPLATPFVKFL